MKEKNHKWVIVVIVAVLVLALLIIILKLNGVEMPIPTSSNWHTTAIHQELIAGTY